LETKKIDLYFSCGYGEINLEAGDNILEDKSQALEANNYQKPTPKLEPV
jgi:hypothetical protein